MGGIQIGRAVLTTPQEVDIVRRRRVEQTETVSGAASPVDSVREQSVLVIRGKEQGALATTRTDELEAEAGRYGSVHVTDLDALVPEGFYELESVHVTKPPGRPFVRPWEARLIKQPDPRARYEAESNMVAGVRTVDAGASEGYKNVYTPTALEVAVAKIGSSLVMALRLDETGGTDGANLVANPGFETWTTSPGVPDSWSNVGGNTSQLSKETVIKRTGSNALKIVADGSTTTPGASQVVAFTGGKSYRVEAWARTDGVAGSRARLTLNNDTDAASMDALGVDAVATFELLSFTFKAIAGKSYTLYTVEHGGSAGTVYFDDVVVKEIQAKDSSGMGNHGTLSGGANTAGPTVGVAGKLGTAYLFDGVDDYVEVPNSPSLSPTAAISVEAWTKVDNLSGTKIIVGKSPQYFLFMTNADIYFRIFKSGVASTVSATLSPGAGVFAHAVGTYDGANVKLYVNGVLVGTTAASGPLDTSSSSVRVGAEDGGVNFFGGVIDEPRVYNRALTAQEVLSRYTTSNAGSRLNDFRAPLDDGLNLPAGTYSVYARVQSRTTITQKFKIYLYNIDGDAWGGTAQVTVPVADTWTNLLLASGITTGAMDRVFGHLKVQDPTNVNPVWIDSLEFVRTA